MKLPRLLDHMDTVVPTLAPATPILEAVRFLLDQKVTGAPVVDPDNRIVGILTETDCLQVLATWEGDVKTAVVSDFMTTAVVTAPPHMDVYYAAGLFLKKPFRRLPVVDDGKLVGAITRFDLLRVIRDNLG